MGSLVFPLASGLGSDTSARPRPKASSVQDKTIGRDKFFNGDKRVTSAGDYQTIEGIANLRQAVFRRLITRRGEFRFRPTYGVGARDYVKRAMTTSNIDELKHRIRENMLQDPRIEGVETEAEKLAIGGIPGLRLHISVKSKGRTLRLEPFTFTVKEA